MKKLLSVALSLLLVLAMASAALAEPFTLEEAGLTIELLEGMTALDASNEEAYMISITVEGNESLVYAFSFMYFEEMAGKGLADLTDEEGEQLCEMIAAEMVDPSFDGVEEDGVPIMLVASGDGTQFYYVIMEDGCLFMAAAGKLDGVALTEEEILVAGELLGSISFAEE